MEPVTIDVNLSVKNLEEIEERVRAVIDENDKLRAELGRIKLSWDDAPPEANFRTHDEDWFAQYWETKPKPHDTEYFSGEKMGEWHGGKSWTIRRPNWQETLEARPCET